MIEPWDQAKRKEKGEQLRDMVDHVTSTMEADGVVIVAFFKDGEHMHVLDGGNCPIPLKKVYDQLSSAHQMSEERGEGFVQ